MDKFTCLRDDYNGIVFAMRTVYFTQIGVGDLQGKALE